MEALPHFYASMLLDVDKSIRVLSGYVDHADPAPTLRTYTHLIRSDGNQTKTVFLILDARQNPRSPQPSQRPKEVLPCQSAPPRNTAPTAAMRISGRKRVGTGGGLAGRVCAFSRSRSSGCWGEAVVQAGAAMRRPVRCRDRAGVIGLTVRH